MEFFGNKQYNEVLEMVDNGGNIMDYFAKTDPLCKEIGNAESPISLIKELGNGVYGTVHKVEIKMKDTPPKWTSRLVVKKMIAEVAPFLITDEKEKERINAFYGEEIDFSNKTSVPYFLLKICSRNTYETTDGKHKYRPKEKSLICNSEHSEFLISLWAGNLFVNNTSINFLPVFYFATCADVKTRVAEYYIFMEQIDSEFCDILIKRESQITNSTIEHIFIQVIHAILVYQTQGALVHGDLHTRNVFITKYKNIETFNGQDLASSDYYEYKIEDRESIYLPGPAADPKIAKYIAKIGDFGTSVKYAPIMVGDFSVIYNEFVKNPKPNWYNISYDIVSLTRSAFYYNPKVPFIRKIMRWMEKVSEENLVKIKHETIFPSAKTLEEKYFHVSPLAILTSPELMGNYLKVPPDGKKISVIGTVY